MNLQITREENIIKVKGDLSPKKINEARIVIKTHDVINWLKEVHSIEVYNVLAAPERGYLHNADRESTLKGEWTFSCVVEKTKKQEKKVEKTFSLKDNINKASKETKKRKSSAFTKKRKSSKTQEE